VETIAPSRDLPFAELFNFRDLGGYRGSEGRSVRWRRLFRSDSLHRLTGADLDLFTGLGVRTVVDLRRPDEVSYYGRVPERLGLGYHHIHPEHADWRERRYTDGEDPGDGWPTAISISPPRAGRDCRGRRPDRRPRSAPVVVHRIAGKDRTGVVARSPSPCSASRTATSWPTTS
jgi:protein tyrosine/serine phosphatase